MHDNSPIDTPRYVQLSLEWRQ